MSAHQSPNQFLTPYRVDLPEHPDFKTPSVYDFGVSAVNDTIDTTAGTRTFTLVVKHEDIIWTSSRLGIQEVEPPQNTGDHSGGFTAEQQAALIDVVSTCIPSNTSNHSHVLLWKVLCNNC